MDILKTTIAHEGQSYIDEPVYLVHKPKMDWASPITMGLAQAFKPPVISALVGRNSANSPVAMPIQELSHYNRVPLRWMKPDGNGGLIPKGKK